MVQFVGLCWWSYIVIILCAVCAWSRFGVCNLELGSHPVDFGVDALVCGDNFQFLLLGPPSCELRRWVAADFLLFLFYILDSQFPRFFELIFGSAVSSSCGAIIFGVGFSIWFLSLDSQIPDPQFLWVNFSESIPGLRVLLLGLWSSSFVSWSPNPQKSWSFSILDPRFLSRVIFPMCLCSNV